MSECRLNVRIINKRDTDENFSSNNPTLLNGEMIIVDDDSGGFKLKFGDGVGTYSQLPFFCSAYSDKPVYTYTEISGLSDILNNLQDQIDVIPIIPSGMIMIWSGDSSNIPDGWVLCDGNNGTPDLSDKFIVGAGNKYNSGDIGGEESHVLTIDEMPSHNHENIYPAVPPSSGGGFEGYAWYTDSYDWGTQKDSLVGGGQAHNNMPPYYALCYIMKT